MKNRYIPPSLLIRSLSPFYFNLFIHCSTCVHSICRKSVFYRFFNECDEFPIAHCSLFDNQFSLFL